MWRRGALQHGGGPGELPRAQLLCQCVGCAGACLAGRASLHFNAALTLALPPRAATCASPCGAAPIRLDVVTSTPGRFGTQALRRSLEADTYLLAAGRDANTANLNLASLGAETDKRGNIVVDEHLRTACPAVYAAGDVLGPPSLASTGVEQAIAAVSTMFGNGSASQGSNLSPSALTGTPGRFPVGVWTTPEMSFIGLRPSQAVELGHDVVVGTAYYSDCLRGHVGRCQLGMLRLTVEKKSGRILGCFIFGDEACELVRGHEGHFLVGNYREHALSVLSPPSRFTTAWSSWREAERCTTSATRCSLP